MAVPIYLDSTNIFATQVILPTTQQARSGCERVQKTRKFRAPGNQTHTGCRILEEMPGFGTMSRISQIQSSKVKAI